MSNCNLELNNEADGLNQKKKLTFSIYDAIYHFPLQLINEALNLHMSGVKFLNDTNPNHDIFSIQVEKLLNCSAKRNEKSKLL